MNSININEVIVDKNLLNKGVIYDYTKRSKFCLQEIFEALLSTCSQSPKTTVTLTVTAPYERYSMDDYAMEFDGDVDKARKEYGFTEVIKSSVKTILNLKTKLSNVDIFNIKPGMTEDIICVPFNASISNSTSGIAFREDEAQAFFAPPKNEQDGNVCDIAKDSYAGEGSPIDISDFCKSWKKSGNKIFAVFEFKHGSYGIAKPVKVEVSFSF